MGNDGLKHVVHRRVHLERSQPERRRRKVGQFLEKKADYKRRAERYHVREKIIKELSSKTRFRNEDEFNFKMIHAKIGQEGQVILESEESARKRKLSKKEKIKNDLNKINRNLFIVNHKQNITKKRIEKLIGSNPALVRPSRPSHIIFEEGEGEPEEEEPKKSKENGKQKLNGVNGKPGGKLGTPKMKVLKSRTKVGQKVKRGLNKGERKGGNREVADEFRQDEGEIFRLSDSFRDNKELDDLRAKLEDRRNLTLAMYKKRQVRKVRNLHSNVKVHEFVAQRMK